MEHDGTGLWQLLDTNSKENLTQGVDDTETESDTDTSPKIYHTHTP